VCDIDSSDWLFPRLILLFDCFPPYRFFWLIVSPIDYSDRLLLHIDSFVSLFLLLLILLINCFSIDSSNWLLLSLLIILFDCSSICWLIFVYLVFSLLIFFIWLFLSIGLVFLFNSWSILVGLLFLGYNISCFGFYFMYYRIE
jgi:hypothetical protein